MPYSRKIVKMSQEPVAFHLYKSRHFKILDTKAVAPSDEDNFQGDDKKDFRY